MNIVMVLYVVEIFYTCFIRVIFLYVYVFSCMYIGMYVYVLYIFLNLIMSTIPTLYFFCKNCYLNNILPYKKNNICIAPYNTIL